MNYINIQQVLDDLLADDMMKGLSLERAINYAVEFIKVIGMPMAFEEKVEEVNIENHRGELPCDFYEEVQVKDPKGCEYLSCETPFGSKIGYTYSIKGNVIFTSVEKAKLCVAYRAFKVDDDGYPMIVDNGSFARALELYLQKRYFTSLFNSGKISRDVLHNTQQEYAFYAGQATNDLVRLSIDQMQSFTNMWTSLLQRHHKHNDGFATVNMPELRKY